MDTKYLIIRGALIVLLLSTVSNADVFNDDFSTPHDYITLGVSGTM